MVDGSIGASSRPVRWMEKKVSNIATVTKLYRYDLKVKRLGESSRNLTFISSVMTLNTNNYHSLIERGVVELDVVAPHAPETGQDLREWGHDEVLAVPISIKDRLMGTLHSVLKSG